jgi:general secretion pathway protein E
VLIESRSARRSFARSATRSSCRSPRRSPPTDRRRAGRQDPDRLAKAHGLLPLERSTAGVVLVANRTFDTDALTICGSLRRGRGGADAAAGARSSTRSTTSTTAARPCGSAALDAWEDFDAPRARSVREPEDLLDSSDEGAPIIRLVNSLLQQAVKERASDIHIEPQEKDLVVRFRVDNILHEPIRPLPRRMQQAITTRIKIMGRLDIAEKRLPQDGRIVLKIAGRDYDVRLSTLPTQYGERCVLRLLPRTQELLSIEKIGLSGRHQETLRKLIRRNNGIILVTGPTGSGKTNTLYAALADINKPEHNIMTIEDPVEIRLSGISQIEVKSSIGLTFAAGLRSILRQNPNVILVGEIRDLETAEVAIQASLTGHLVFSTIHTNESAGTITRLIDMGVEPFLISSSLVAAIAQRLIRVVCKRCREAYTPSDEELAEIGLRRADVGARTIYRAKGCVHCNHTGYHGRTGIFEILIIDDAIRGMITRGVDSKQIQDQAIRLGMQTMRFHGARMVLDGNTTVAEILRQTEEEAVAALDPQAA